MSDLTKARDALAAGRRDEALGHAWNAARAGPRRELPEVARLAAALDDPALAAAVLVRQVRGERSRAREVVSNAIVTAIGFAWWLGWSSLVAFAVVEDRLVAGVAAVAAALVIVVGISAGWIAADD